MIELHVSKDLSQPARVMPSSIMAIAPDLIKTVERGKHGKRIVKTLYADDLIVRTEALNIVRQFKALGVQLLALPVGTKDRVYVNPFAVQDISPFENSSSATALTLQDKDTLLIRRSPQYVETYLRAGRMANVPDLILTPFFELPAREKGYVVVQRADVAYLSESEERPHTTIITARNKNQIEIDSPYRDVAKLFSVSQGTRPAMGW